MKLSNHISNWINEYLAHNKLDALIIGVSGGIDSAVVSTLCAMTGRKTIVVSLPIYQEHSQLKRANNHIHWLQDKFDNVVSMELSLNDVYSEFEKLFFDKSLLTSANTKSRLRMTALYHISGLNNGIVVGTGNKVEDFGIGFYTKYGDGGVDISPIGDLLKTEVWELGKELGLLQEIIDAKPTDGLWEDDRCDEDQIGASYTELEWAMSYDGIEKLTERQNMVLDIFSKFNTQNKHKMMPIPIFKKDFIYE